MYEIRFHGRGGQGAVIGATVLAEAAFREGKDVQSFPYFGVERRGAPVTAFTRIDNKPIRIRSQIYEPDCIVVLEPHLLKMLGAQITDGLKPNGTIIVNTSRKPAELNLSNAKLLATVNATDIAVQYGLGTKAIPIVNTAILGGVCRVTQIVRLESIFESIANIIPTKKNENIAAAKVAFETVEVLELG